MPDKRTISEEQLAANRANAQKSTGPRTADGRRAVSLNAVKHGLAANTTLLPGEDLATHEAFCREIIIDLFPGNAVEFNLAQSIAQDLWRLSRAAAVDSNIFAAGLMENDDDPDPDHDPAAQVALSTARTFVRHSQAFGLLSLYEQRIHRAVHKNREALRRMQAERRRSERANENGFVYADGAPEEQQPGPVLVKTA